MKECNNAGPWITVIKLLCVCVCVCVNDGSDKGRDFDVRYVPLLGVKTCVRVFRWHLRAAQCFWQHHPCWARLRHRLSYIINNWQLDLSLSSSSVASTSWRRHRRHRRYRRHHSALKSWWHANIRRLLLTTTPNRARQPRYLLHTAGARLSVTYLSLGTFPANNARRWRLAMFSIYVKHKGPIIIQRLFLYTALTFT